MKLYYHKGANFGDAINPMIFEKILGVQFDEDEEIGIVGIGSILGHFRPTEKTKKFYVFSSGFAGGDASTYGTPPEIKLPYEVICVRGKSTAKALGIDERYAVADGALPNLSIASAWVGALPTGLASALPMKDNSSAKKGRAWRRPKRRPLPLPFRCARLITWRPNRGGLSARLRHLRFAS